jgi:hypothetical protein
MEDHIVTIEQVRHYTVTLQASSVEDAINKADQIVPDNYEPPSDPRVKRSYGASRIVPPASEFNVDKHFASVSEAIDYLKSQVDPYDCLFRLLKHQCYWGEQEFCVELLAAATDIIEATQGEGYYPN